MWYHNKHNRSEFEGVFGLVFVPKSQTKGPNPASCFFFSKSRLSHGAKLKTPLDLFLVDFEWKTFSNIYRKLLVTFTKQILVFL